jgi:hypothetical protein
MLAVINIITKGPKLVDSAWCFFIYTGNWLSFCDYLCFQSWCNMVQTQYNASTEEGTNEGTYYSVQS